MEKTPSPLRSAVVLGGSGAVGRMLAAELTGAGIRVTVADKTVSATGSATIAADARRPGPALHDVLAEADVVVMALPEDVACVAVAPVTAAMRHEALLVDTLSVKGGIVPMIEASTVAEAVSVNPMFHPDLGLRGRPIVVVPVRKSLRARAFLDVLSASGAQLTELTSAEHDGLMAAAQVVTHAAILSVGASLRALGTNFATLCAVAPPPHLTMLALLARLCAGEPSVYHDIQAANPAAPAARQALVTSLTELDSLVADGTTAKFAQYLEDIRAHLGANAGALARYCAELFHMPPPRFPTAD